MRSKILISGLLASVMFVPAALAQQTNAPAPSATTSTMTQTAPMGQSGQWRASKLMGLDVHNEQNEKLGDINEILLDQSGKVTGVVIGVGGFLGMGEHDVLVKMEDLKFMTEPLRTTAAPANRPNTGTNAPANQPARAQPARAANEKWYPDHVVIQATKEQLKAMPGFKYSSYN